MYKILYINYSNYKKKKKKTLHTSIIRESIKFFGKKVLKGGNKNAFKDFTLYHKREMSVP